MRNSIYDKNYEWELKDDIEFIKQLAMKKVFGHETNLVSHFFDGIQVFEVSSMLICM